MEQLRRDSSRSPPLKAAKHSPQDAAPARRRADGDAEGSPLPKRRPQVAWLAAHFQDLREHCEAGRHQEVRGRGDTEMNQIFAAECMMAEVCASDTFCSHRRLAS